ncbi:hypothetical protein OH76DRAFT_1008073 [Lentinus brumalis]|uniref:Uncharacterized protein n=1 Tax=Lentinus brumalis TaxID=2498619 RepID=A0A371CY94_9APHY|nr:hypothetical protein OH76DRAFT_1008073 [Polyporus brumalis]
MCLCCGWPRCRLGSQRQDSCAALLNPFQFLHEARLSKKMRVYADYMRLPLSCGWQYDGLATLSSNGESFRRASCAFSLFSHRNDDYLHVRQRMCVAATCGGDIPIILTPPSPPPPSTFWAADHAVGECPALRTPRCSHLSRVPHSSSVASTTTRWMLCCPAVNSSGPLFFALSALWLPSSCAAPGSFQDCASSDCVRSPTVVDPAQPS